MPAKNTIKVYVENGYYHLYNRGVNKMDIFTDERDYRVFLSYLKNYLFPKDPKALMSIISDPKSSQQEVKNAKKLMRLNNFHGKIELLAYCLMPNHYHFLVKQISSQDLELFMKSSMTRYAQYFNKRHKRVGPIYQGRYKAILVDNDPQLLHLTRYIHRNPLDPERTVLPRTVLFKKLLSQPSSYPVYLGRAKQAWVKPSFILQNFSGSSLNSYKSFVESDDADLERQTMFTVSNIALDLERTVL